MRKVLFATLVVSGALLAATASLAASDFYLKINGAEGETTANSRSKHIELESWSLGASQAGIVSPRDAASGLPTGKRQHRPIAVIKPVEASSARAAATTASEATAPATTAEVQTVSFVVPEPSDESMAELARMCASGQHIKSAMLGSPSGRYQLKDAVITSCAVNGNQRRYEFRGHVTLMK